MQTYSVVINGVAVGGGLSLAEAEWTAQYARATGARTVQIVELKPRLRAR